MLCLKESRKDSAWQVEGSRQDFSNSLCGAVRWTTTAVRQTRRPRNLNENKSRYYALEREWKGEGKIIGLLHDVDVDEDDNNNNNNQQQVVFFFLHYFKMQNEKEQKQIQFKGQLEPLLVVAWVMDIM